MTADQKKKKLNKDESHICQKKKHLYDPRTFGKIFSGLTTNTDVSITSEVKQTAFQEIVPQADSQTDPALKLKILLFKSEITSKLKPAWIVKQDNPPLIPPHQRKTNFSSC